MSLMLLPDGSRKPVSMPYGCVVGGSLNFHPARGQVVVGGLAVVSLQEQGAAGAPGDQVAERGAVGRVQHRRARHGHEHQARGHLALGPTHSQRKFQASIVTSVSTSQPSVLV